jgi:membrane protease YdiL (CAAX protease family)
MPYAFVAGVLFMVIDVALGSIWPSVILHFLNNAISIVSMKYCSDLPRVIIFISLMLLISLASLIVLYRRRTEYKELFVGALDKGEGLSTTYAPFALAIICCLVAAASI